MRWVTPREDSINTRCLFLFLGGAASSTSIASSALRFPFESAFAAFAFWAFKTEDMAEVMWGEVCDRPPKRDEKCDRRAGA